MRGPAVRPVVIAAGGTGGHFFPAEALAAQLARRGRRIVLMTDARSAGLRSPVFEGRECFVLRGAGIAGRGVWRGAKAALALSTGVIQARLILRQLNPAVIVGFGGYPAIAPILGNRLRLWHRAPVLLHEQNAVLGRANMLLSRQADVLALTFANTARKPASCVTEITGNPVRPAIAALLNQAYDAPHDVVNLLVLGGSLGARVLSDVVPGALAALPEPIRARLVVTQQCRAEDLTRVRNAYAAYGIAAELAPFFDDIATRLAAAHLVIARAGASTVAELAVAGRPSILVPLPGAIDDHQSANAAALGSGAWVLAQPNFTESALADLVSQLLTDTALLQNAARVAGRHGVADAAARLADLVEAHMTQESFV
jgi:UDP-N-acetylglucosamine--N-acetylmuramyl-(pentapeptide) pyrophosphoryl-undecaprenol N-acetylglucosamine transferase